MTVRSLSGHSSIWPDCGESSPGREGPGRWDAPAGASGCEFGKAVCGGAGRGASASDICAVRPWTVSAPSTVTAPATEIITIKDHAKRMKHVPCQYGRDVGRRPIWRRAPWLGDASQFGGGSPRLPLRRGGSQASGPLVAAAFCAGAAQTLCNAARADGQLPGPGRRSDAGQPRAPTCHALRCPAISSGSNSGPANAPRPSPGAPPPPSEASAASKRSGR